MIRSVEIAFPNGAAGRHNSAGDGDGCPLAAIICPIADSSTIAVGVRNNSAASDCDIRGAINSALVSPSAANPGGRITCCCRDSAAIDGDGAAVSAAATADSRAGRTTGGCNIAAIYSNDAAYSSVFAADPGLTICAGCG